MDECVVLLVDDETDYREVLMRRLKKRKVNVTGVDNGSEAL
ncbi:MAG: response regulator, partial [Desulfobacterales bacterium]|nr:response regulator [Desulfobacterales bacterium]